MSANPLKFEAVLLQTTVVNVIADPCFQVPKKEVAVSNQT